jgi:hypothetical protein
MDPTDRSELSRFEWTGSDPSRPGHPFPPTTPRRPPPRNYLSRVEQRRLFWIVMPPAAVAILVGAWVERRLRGTSPADGGSAQVDTVLHDAADRPGLEGLLERSATGPSDAVVIGSAADESPPAEAMEIGANERALAAVQDDTVFRESDAEAWFGLFETLRSTPPEALRASRPRAVGFNELFGQPESFRGRLVRFRGSIRRLEWLAAPANNSNMTGYWQAWLRPQAGPPSPIVVYFLELPPEWRMASGWEGDARDVDLPVEVIGYFFKRWAYRATDTIRTAPLVVARSPLPLALPSPASSSVWLGVAIVSFMAGLVGLAALSLWLLNRRAPRRRPAAVATLPGSAAPAGDPPAPSSEGAP